MTVGSRAAAPFLLFAALLGQAAHGAAEEPSHASPSNKVCELLPEGALSPWGYDAATLSRVATGTSVEKGVNKAPSDVQTHMCFIYKDGTPKKGSTAIILESFAPEVDAAAISRWIKELAANAKADNADMNIEESVIDGATCETGSYMVPESGGPNVMEHYVACDRVVDRRHISISIHQPDMASGLPTTVDLKALLDQAAARLATVP